MNDNDNDNDNIERFFQVWWSEYGTGIDILQRDRDLRAFRAGWIARDARDDALAERARKHEGP